MAQEKVVMSEEEELQQSIAYLQVVNAQLDALSRQAKLLQATLTEHLQAKETLNAYKKLKKGEELLVPIGAGSYVFAKVSDPTKVIIGIGANISTEESIDSATDKLETRIKTIEDSERKVAESIHGLEQQAGALTLRVQELYESLQMKGKIR
jgi:prefoldin alpha subunit